MSMPAKTSSSKQPEQSPTPAAMAPTLRNRHDKTPAKPSTTTDQPTSSPATAATPSSAPPKRDTSTSISAKTVLLGALFIVASMGCVLCVLLAVQIVALDGADLSKTAMRLQVAGRGEVWFPVWLGNMVVDSLTATRIDLDGRGGGGAVGPSSGRKTIGSGPPPPPPLLPVRRPPPPPPRTPTQESEDSTTGHVPDTESTDDTAAAGAAPLRCYTLEAYSEVFLQAPRKGKADHFFSCGTRVSDLRTEDRPAVLAACAAHTVYPATTSGTAATRHTAHSTLRVLLTPSEEKRHRAVQPVNTVTQRIPLLRFNDDYCDCLDGTDELLTNACSMSGPLAPAAGSRWKPYLVSNQAIQLYDTPDALEVADAASRGPAAVPRRRGDVGDRLHVAQGPVLPFLCTCAGSDGGVVRQYLAPSLLGDGVVDCCGGEDEAVLQGSPYVPPSLFTNNPLAVQAGLDRVLQSTRAAMRRTWKQRRAVVAGLLSATDSVVSYVDALFPHHTSAHALLVDKGYLSLFPADVVVRERRAAAALLRDLYARGHLMQRRRVQKGWAQLGQGLSENRTMLQRELANITQELESMEKFVHERMSETRASHPLEAGIPMELLQRHDQLAHAHQGMRMEMQHLVLTTLHHAYGDHYEYYPLVRRALSLVSAKVTDASTPPDLYSGIAQERAKRVMSPSAMARMAAAAQQRGESVVSLHIDNISVSHVGLEVMRHTMVAQRFSAAEAPFVAQQLGLLPHESPAPFNPHVFDTITDPFLRAPVVPLGAWQPHQVERDGHSMQLADPAGDVHLARRAFVSPASSLYRGGGRLQLPTRHPEAPRTVTIADEAEDTKTLKEKLKAVAEGTPSTGKKVDVPHHFHTPSIFAVGRYVGSVRCDPGPLPASASRRHSPDDDGDGQKVARVVETYVTLLCDTKDRLLYWGRNGKCTQEVIVGTPSACTAWALKAARDALKAVAPRNDTKETLTSESSTAA